MKSPILVREKKYQGMGGPIPRAGTGKIPNRFRAFSQIFRFNPRPGWTFVPTQHTVIIMYSLFEKKGPNIAKCPCISGPREPRRQPVRREDEVPVRPGRILPRPTAGKGLLPAVLAAFPMPFGAAGSRLVECDLTAVESTAKAGVRSDERRGRHRYPCRKGITIRK